MATMKTQDSAGASIFGDKSDVAKELFVIAVTVLAVAPRLPMDEPWTIGVIYPTVFVNSFW